MSESGSGNKRVLTETEMRARLNRSDEMREFFIEMWKQNPELAKQGGVRVQNLLSSVEGKQRGISLIELIIFIVIISVALTGILLVMNQVTANSADPLVRKQAIAAAESLLEEIQLQDFVSQAGATNAVTQANRATQYHIVSDYNGFATAGVYQVGGGTPIVGLENFDAAVTVIPAVLNGIAAANAVQITVTVTTPQGEAITIDGFRTAY